MFDMSHKNTYPNWKALSFSEKRFIAQEITQQVPRPSNIEDIDREYYNEVLEEAARKYLADDSSWANIEEFECASS